LLLFLVGVLNLDRILPLEIVYGHLDRLVVLIIEVHVLVLWNSQMTLMIMMLHKFDFCDLIFICRDDMNSWIWQEIFVDLSQLLEHASRIIVWENIDLLPDVIAILVDFMLDLVFHVQEGFVVDLELFVLLGEDLTKHGIPIHGSNPKIQIKSFLGF
jgi:hypothetical protein